MEVTVSFLIGIFLGSVVGIFVASLLAAGARQRGIEDAEALADELERDVEREGQSGRSS